MASGGQMFVHVIHKPFLNRIQILPQRNALVNVFVHFDLPRPRPVPVPVEGPLQDVLPRPRAVHPRQGVQQPPSYPRVVVVRLVVPRSGVPVPGRELARHPVAPVGVAQPRREFAVRRRRTGSVGAVAVAGVSPLSALQEDESVAQPEVACEPPPQDFVPSTIVVGGGGVAVPSLRVGELFRAAAGSLPEGLDGVFQGGSFGRQSSQHVVGVEHEASALSSLVARVLCLFSPPPLSLFDFGDQIAHRFVEGVARPLDGFVVSGHGGAFNP
mmetsp:Transcript_34834/g.74240  ORF Transcript_34834/g.74240 Transcript_34834/m.74240 type:complete len:270 (+) Transcript_34834:2495-3304(+)